MRPADRQLLALATLAVAAALKAKIPGDAAEEHESNTFGLPNGDPLRKALRQFFAEQAKKLVGFVEAAGAEIPAVFPSLADYSDPMASAMTPLLGVYWSKAGKALRGRLGLDPEEWRVTDPNLHKAIADAALQFCTSTNETTDVELAAALSELKGELHQGLVTHGEAIPELVARVQKVFVRAKKARAVAIARTEAARAVHAAALASAEASGVVAAKKWLTSANSCAVCHKLADDVGAIPLDLAFGVVGHSAAYSVVKVPPAHPHCRCSMTFELTDPAADPVPAFEHAPPGAIPASKPRKKKAAAVAGPEPTATPEPEPTPATGPSWPSDPDKLRVVRKLGGSTGAELVEDDAGQRFVRKRGANAEHLRSEVEADQIYRQFGVPVPEPRLYETDKGPVKLARFVEGRTLADLERADPRAARAAEARLRDHFAVDALLGNWDVVGLSKDNVLVDDDGTPWRIDNGGSLEFRAQGAKKGPAQWNANPLDLWSMRDPKVNPSAASVFHQVTSDDWARQAQDLGKAGVDLPPAVRDRLAQMQDLAAIHRTLRDDRFKPSYTDDFARHTAGIRAAGITAKLPTELTRPPGSRGGTVEVQDQDGRIWDHLRGRGSLATEFDAYLKSQGCDPGLLAAWKEQQGGDSWNMYPAAAKWLLHQERTVDVADYWWKEGLADAPDQYNVVTKRHGTAFRKAIVAQHAYTREILAKAAFDLKTPDGKVRLMRTESLDVMRMNGLKVGQKGCMMKRGAAESTSIYRKVSVYGTELTVQDVPIHRVLGTYWQARGHDLPSMASFAGDNENEFVALLDGIPFDYVKPGRDRKPEMIL